MMSGENPSSQNKGWIDRVPDFLSVAVGLVLWRLFFPGFMSADSIAQYEQAVLGDYSDWHPPLMSLVLRAAMGVGVTIGLLMLFQCLAGVFGIRALASGVLKQLFGDRITPRRAAWLSFLVLLALLVPVTPLAFYLMTFWKDAWAMILLLWIGALSLDLDQRPEGSGRRMLLLVVLAAALGLVRHNAIVTLPLVGLVLFVRSRQLGRPAALALAAAPLVLWFTAGAAIDRVFRVEKMNPDSQIMMLDLVGLCAEGRKVCQQLPWTHRHILDEASLATYRPGDLGFILWDEPKHIDLAFREYPPLKAEYRRAVLRFPHLLLKVKLEAFATMLGHDRTFYFFHSTIVDNPYKLGLNMRFERERQWLSRITGAVGGHPLLRWISGVHLVWIVVNALLIAGLLVKARRSGEERLRFLALVLLVPLAYYFSYVMATPIHDFRFMYPSTLVVQCVAGAGVVGRLLQTPAGRKSGWTQRKDGVVP